MWYMDATSTKAQLQGNTKAIEAATAEGEVLEVLKHMSNRVAIYRRVGRDKEAVKVAMEREEVLAQYNEDRGGLSGESMSFEEWSAEYGAPGAGKEIVITEPQVTKPTPRRTPPQVVRLEIQLIGRHYDQLSKVAEGWNTTPEEYLERFIEDEIAKLMDRS